MFGIPVLRAAVKVFPLCQCLLAGDVYPAPPTGNGFDIMRQRARGAGTGFEIQSPDQGDGQPYGEADDEKAEYGHRVNYTDRVPLLSVLCFAEVIISITAVMWVMG